MSTIDTHAVTANVQWYPPLTVLTPGVGTANDFSATAVTNILSVLLANAQVALRGDATSGSWIGSAQVPVTGGPANLNVRADGFAEQPAGAKTSIFIVIGAVLQSIAFDDVHSGNFTETYTASIGDEAQQTITVVVLAERAAGGGDDVLVGLDSLDITTA